MGHLNELQDKYGKEGLTVIGVTGEGKGETEAWIEKHGARYGYAYDKAGRLMSQLGLSGYPSAAVVDPNGQVVWTGHPSGLNAGILKPYLDQSLPLPAWEWPDAAKAVKQAFLKGQYGKAVMAAEKLSPDELGLGQALRSVAKAQVAGVQAAYEAGDYLTASEGLKRVKKSVDGLAEESEAAKALEQEFTKNRDAKSVMKAQKFVRDMANEQPRRKKECQEILERLSLVSKKNADNAAGREAADLAKRIQELHDRLAH